VQALPTEIGSALPRLFRDPTVSGLVVVLAVGATVRLLAPWLRGKTSDPALVAVDDGGRFAIALLSGHLGGANALAHQVAHAIDATPVVTTASDGAGLPALDLLGAEGGWKVEATSEALRHASAALVNGQAVGVYQDAGSQSWQAGGLPSSVRALETLDDSPATDLAVLLVVTDRQVVAPEDVPWCITYRPPTLVAGVGCSRGATADDIETTIGLALERGGLAHGSLARMATIDRRLNEPGVVECAERLGLPLQGFPAEELANVWPLPSPSEVVHAAVGTYGVCEPAALLASGADHLLVPKVKTARATAAIARLVGA
jgi:cobalt-precorrin 5A hydrolase